MRRVTLTALILPLLATLALAAGCGSDDSQDVPPGAIAVVDGEEISKERYDRLLAQTKEGYEKQGQKFPKQGTPEYATIKNNIVRFLVERKYFELAAADMDVEVTDEEVTKRLEDLKQQIFKGDEKKYAAALEEAGKTEAEVREDVRDRIVQEKVAQKLTEEIEVTDEDVEKYYRERQSEFRTPAQREVRHILVAVCGEPRTEGCTKSEAKAKQEAESLRRQISNGGDFAKLAKANSDDPGSKESGGQLTVAKGSTEPPFDAAAFTLETGTLSQPVRTRYGFHLIEPLKDVQPAKTRPLKDARATIRSTLIQQRRSEALTNWVKETQEKYREKTTYQVGYQPPRTATQTASQ